jgi:RNA recognition motif-containing protein
MAQPPTPAGQDPAPDPCNLIVNYIPTPVTDAELYAMFSQYGELVSARVIVDRVTGHPKGYGFVKYRSVEDANSAMLHMNGFAIHGKRFKVTPARGFQSTTIDAWSKQASQHHFQLAAPQIDLVPPPAMAGPPAVVRYPPQVIRQFGEYYDGVPQNSTYPPPSLEAPSSTSSANADRYRIPSTNASPNAANNPVYVYSSPPAVAQTMPAETRPTEARQGIPAPPPAY